MVRAFDARIPICLVAAAAVISACSGAKSHPIADRDADPSGSVTGSSSARAGSTPPAGGGPGMPPAVDGDAGSFAAIDGGASGQVAAPGAPIDEFADFCIAMAEARCAVELPCCEARGFATDLKLCAASTWWQDQRCWWLGGFVPDNYDPQAARACVDLHTDSFVDCHPRRADDPQAIAAFQACEAVAPPDPIPTGGACNGCPTCCAAPAGMVALCNFGYDGLPDTCGAPMSAAKGPYPCGYSCPQSRSDGTECFGPAECASGYCDSSTRQCGSHPPPIADNRCELLDELARYGLYAEGRGRLFVTDRELLWPMTTADGSFDDLHRAPKDGSGPITALQHDGPTLSGPVLATNDAIYRGDSTRIKRISLDDGSETTFADFGYQVQVLARHGDHLVVGGYNCAAVGRVSLVDASVQRNPEPFALPADDNESGVAIAIVADDDGIYCARGRHLARFENDGSATLVTDALLPDDFVDGSSGGLYPFGDTLLVVASHVSDGQSRVGTLVAFELASGSAEEVVLPEAPLSNTLADEARGQLYWRVQEGIQVFDVTTGNFDLLELRPDASWSTLYADDGYLYWAKERGTYRRAKP